MKIAIMQPYLFPYIGYFQLINAVDSFGIGDDVQFIKSGWIQRNRILGNGEPTMFSFSVKKDSYQKTIKERYYNSTFSKEAEKLLRILKLYYSKAPFYEDTIKIIESVFKSKESNISLFNTNQLKIICNYLEINTPFLESDQWKIEDAHKLNVEERLIKKLEKLKKIKATHFINPIGGSALYHKDFFKKNNFNLSFLECNAIDYKQFKDNFVSKLSIIDVMMFNSREQIKEMLTNYTFR